MTALYKIIKDSEFEGAVVIIEDREPLTIGSDHPNFQAIKEHLYNEVDDDEHLLSLISPAEQASEKMIQLSERVRFANGMIYFDGDLLDSAITDHIVRIIEDGGEEAHWAPLVNFLEKVSTNPSKKSRKHLFHFIRSNKMTLAPDGDLIAYKGVSTEGKSIHAGYGIVNGEVFEFEHLDNSIGNVVEIPRSMVDDDRDAACSVGLHVGAHVYAASFAQRLLTVKVNPRDVVSVPSDYNDQKVRVTRYLVLENNEQEYSGPTYFKAAPEVKVFKADPVAEADLAKIVEDDADEAETEPRFESTQPILGVVTPPAEDETEASDEEVYANAKVAEFEALIPVLQTKGEPLRRWRNKRVTAKGRPFFDKAMENLGLTY